MNTSSLKLFCASLCVVAVVACGDDDAAPPVDAGGADLASVDGAAGDAATADDAGANEDAATPDDLGAGVDSGADIDSGVATDAGTALDGGAATVDSGAANACESAGGSCVAVVPRACPRGIIGDGDVYSCGPGIGTQCCLPLSTPPMCLGVGGRSEGWYAADGVRICGVGCDGATLACENAGTRSEGWYATPATAGCGGGGPGSRLVQFANCAP
jgi:hypothetical protein